jgi:hypothetical protein
VSQSYLVLALGLVGPSEKQVNAYNGEIDAGLGDQGGIQRVEGRMFWREERGGLG